MIVEPEIEIDNSLPLWMNFDFYISPATCLLFQVKPFEEGGIFFIKEYQVDGGTRRLCEHLLVYKDHPYLLYVTGDKSGHARSSSTGDLLTDFTIIQESLELNDTMLINTRNAIFSTG